MTRLDKDYGVTIDYLHAMKCTGVVLDKDGDVSKLHNFA